MRLNPGSRVCKRHRAGDLAACDTQEVRQDDLLLSSNLELYEQGINLAVKVNSRMNCACYVFVHAFSTDILLHLKQFPLLCIIMGEFMRYSLCQRLPW